MELHELAQALSALGLPGDKTEALAAQLDKRARQLAAQRGGTYEEALLHLLKLLREGMGGNAASPGPPADGKDGA